MPALVDDFGDPVNVSTDDSTPDVEIKITSISLAESGVTAPSGYRGVNKYKVRFRVEINDYPIVNFVHVYAYKPRYIERTILDSGLMPHVWNNFEFRYYGSGEPTPEMKAESRQIFDNLVAQCQR